MKTAGIIVEYNPFHNGHLYHIEHTRQMTGADFVIAVMSGNFVQRGTPALLDKYIRTRMALLCGADLVLELPAVCATGSAGDFASGAVALLDQLGIVDFLVFGSEGNDIGSLLQAAKLLAAEPAAFSSTLQEHLKAGMSFPRARALALEAHLPRTASAHRLSAPNDILGLEYCTALCRRKSTIRPLSLQRQGAGYHSQSLTEDFVSASGLRSLLAQAPDAGWPSIAAYVPEILAPLWQDILKKNTLLFADDLCKELRYRLLCEAAAGFWRYGDVTRELSDKLKNNCFSFTGWDHLCEQLKSKEMTYSRLSRALCHILLGLTDEDLACARQNHYAPYARILGFRKEAAPLLTAIKKNSAIPLLSKLADAHRSLSPAGMQLLQKDILAAHIHESAMAAKTGGLPQNEFTRQIVIL